MKVLVLSRNARSYTSHRLTTTLRRLGQDVVVADPMRCTLTIEDGRPGMLHDGDTLRGTGVVVPRFPPEIPRACLAVLRQLENMGVPSLNGADALERTRDRLAVLQALARRGIPTPATAFCLELEEVRRAIDALGGPPVVLRALDFAPDSVPMIAGSVDSAVSLVEAFTGVARPLLIQRLPSDDATVLRTLVVGDAVTAFRRDLRTDAAGTEAPLVPVRTQDAHARLAVGSCRALGLWVATVDLVLSRDAARVLDVSSAPGLEALESAAGADLAMPVARLAISLGATHARRLSA
jgi:ribosomal protein S6--L-glutamate ligase